MHADRTPSVTSPIDDDSADAYTGSGASKSGNDAPMGFSEQMNHSSGSFELVLSSVVLGLIGLWIDRRIGTTPAFTVGLTVLGFIGAGASLYYRYKYEIDRLQAETTALRSGTVRSGTQRSTAHRSATPDTGTKAAG